MTRRYQTAFTILDEVIKATNRRVNAIEHVVIPRLENTVSYINSELDEMDRRVPTSSSTCTTALELIPSPLSRRCDLREEFFRLKKIQGKKKRDTEAAEAEMAAEKRDDVEYSADSGIGGGEAGGKDMLDQGKDEDVIF